MHSTKSKCRVSFAASAAEGKSSPLPLATLCLLGVLLFDQIGFGSALRCYQGQLALQLPISGSPTDCPMQSYTCIKSVDYTQGFVTRACQSTNCTQPNSMIITTSSVCQNSSGYPPQTFCCCYGDGCNSALGQKSMGIVLLALLSVAATFSLGCSMGVR